MQDGNKNIGVSAGVVAQGGIVIDLDYMLPYSRIHKPSIINLSVSKVIKLTQRR